MTTLAPRRIPNVVFGLSLFWGGVLTAFFWTSGFNFKFLLPWLGALAAGMCVAHSQSAEFKKRILAKLKYDESAKLPVTHRSAFKNTERGVMSTLGPVPFHEVALPRLQSYSFPDLEAHAPVELLTDDHFGRLFGKFLGETARQKHPAHVALFDALAMTMLHPDNLKVPAGIDRHGGRSLLTHSLLVCGLMVQRAEAHVYVPMYGLTAINIDFKLDPSDPLIPVVAMAHDLGKIRKMVIGSDGNGTLLLPGHDKQSARDVAKLVEYWSAEISAEDRRILHAVLAYSGAVADLPVQRVGSDGKAYVTSDRLLALCNLLGECDRLAGSIEMGSSYQFGEPPKVVAKPAEVQEVIEPLNLFNSLSKYFLMSMPVNARSPMRSVGFKYKDQEFSRDRHVVIIDEKEFVSSFAKFMDTPDLGIRDGKSSALTKATLETLDANGFLFRFDEGEGLSLRPATSCLYKISFRNAGAPVGSDPALVISSTFVIDVTDWPSMQKLQAYPNCHSTPSLSGFLMGRQQPAQARRSMNEAIATEALTGQPVAIGQDINAFLAAHQPRKKKKDADPAKLVNRIGTALLNKVIDVAAMDETALAIVGFDEFFRGLGLTIEHYDTLPGAFNGLGITQITKSVKNPDTHVIRLDKAVYRKYIVRAAV